MSTNQYEPDRSLTTKQIETLIQHASLSPSAYNLQNWRFIAVQSDDAKHKLQKLAYGQPQITHCAVAFIICGTLDAHRQLHETLQPSVDASIIPISVQDSWVTNANFSHGTNPQVQRDEAIRSASLASMTLQFSAVERLDSACCFMGSLNRNS